VKILLLAVALLALAAILSGTAQAYDPYYDPNYYDPYNPNVGVDYAAPYDPYYELHLIHYQLYLRSYPYPYPYYVVPLPVFPVRTPPVVVAPSRTVRTVQPVRARGR
jgi:hypothetical protein